MQNHDPGKKKQKRNLLTNPPVKDKEYKRNELIWSQLNDPVQKENTIRRWSLQHIKDAIEWHKKGHKRRMPTPQ